jgi:hypothetical protein
MHTCSIKYLPIALVEILLRRRRIETIRRVKSY